MTPYFISYSEIYHTSFDYNKKQVRIHLNSHSKASITYSVLSTEPVDIHIGDPTKPERVMTVYENCTISRKKTKKGESLFLVSYERSRGATSADKRPYLIDAILEDLA